jgi:hypothetical protein
MSNQKFVSLSEVMSPIEGLEEISEELFTLKGGNKEKESGSGCGCGCGCSGGSGCGCGCSS